MDRTDRARLGRVPTLHEPALTRDLAIWRAAHQVADTDQRPTGPPMSAVRNGYQQHRLDRRVSDTGAMPREGRRPDRPTWRRPSIPTSPPTRTGQHWPSSYTSPTAKGLASRRRPAPHRHHATDTDRPTRRRVGIPARRHIGDRHAAHDDEPRGRGDREVDRCPTPYAARAHGSAFTLERMVRRPYEPLHVQSLPPDDLRIV